MRPPYTIEEYFMLLKKKYPILQNQTSYASYLHHFAPPPQNSGKLKVMYFGKFR